MSFIGQDQLRFKILEPRVVAGLLQIDEIVVSEGTVARRFRERCTRETNRSLSTAWRSRTETAIEMGRSMEPVALCGECWAFAGFGTGIYTPTLGITFDLLLPLQGISDIALDEAVQIFASTDAQFGTSGFV